MATALSHDSPIATTAWYPEAAIYFPQRRNLHRSAGGDEDQIIGVHQNIPQVDDYQVLALLNCAGSSHGEETKS